MHPIDALDLNLIFKSFPNPLFVVHKSIHWSILMLRDFEDLIA